MNKKTIFREKNKSEAGIFNPKMILNLQFLKKQIFVTFNGNAHRNLGTLKIWMRKIPKHYKE
jgi:hypothetical protein